GVGSHPFPFRTRKLSLLPPMVLHGKLCGRVGRCRHYSWARESFDSRAFRFCAATRTRRSPEISNEERRNDPEKSISNGEAPDRMGGLPVAEPVSRAPRAWHRTPRHGPAP